MIVTSRALLRHRRRTFGAAASALLVFLSLAASAQQPDASASTATAAPPTFGVLSLIGDEFSVVTRRMSTGSNADTNDRRAYPVADPLFDRTAATEAESVLAQARPGAPVLRLLIRDARLFALQSNVLASTPESSTVRDALVKLLRDNGVTMLVLVTKRRDEAAFKFVHSTTGIGKLRGLGFYIDPDSPNRRIDTNERADGYVAPYVYIDVAVVDITTMQVVKSVPALESTMVTEAGHKDAYRAWDALTAEQKVQALDRLIRHGVAEVLKRALVG